MVVGESDACDRAGGDSGECFIATAENHSTYYVPNFMGRRTNVKMICYRLAGVGDNDAPTLDQHANSYNFTKWYHD